MSNMSYCRFENTLHDLRECAADLEQGVVDSDDPLAELSGDERAAAVRMIELCGEIAQYAEDHEEITGPVSAEESTREPERAYGASARTIRDAIPSDNPLFAKIDDEVLGIEADSVVGALVVKLCAQVAALFAAFDGNEDGDLADSRAEFIEAAAMQIRVWYFG